MRNNKSLRISMAGTRKTKHWPKAALLWSEFVDRLKNPVRSTETMEEYLSFPKSKQDDLKDTGGFVGGTFANDIRKAAYVEGRDLLTLDLDNIQAGGTEDILKRVSGLGCAAAVYSTRKHTGYVPRLRVIVPLDRTAAADEYEPVARKLASLIGIEFCDPTTFDVSRLMYWPSCCRDGEYVLEIFDNPFCSLDGLLHMYGDWTDVSQWPQVPGYEAVERRRLAKQEDPASKRGIIGAFCRTYTVSQAMDKFIPGMYEETDTQGRYTYTGGSTVGGAVLYDGDMFLYSHHATDPCSGLLVNAFDLIRLHKFGDQDQEAKDGTPVNKLPSFVSMSRLASSDPAVSDLLAREKLEQARNAFNVPEAGEEEEDLDWIGRLTKDGNGRIAKTINNAVIILENDPLLKGKIARDEFLCCGVALGRLPWDMEDGKHRWTDVDDAGFYSYMELFYGLTGKDRLDNALLIVSSQNSANEVRDYLKSLQWDGKKRLDTLLCVYLGAEDNAYTRAVMRKSLCAAVARAVVGGVKYDNMPILTGPQGIGKSTFLRTLGKEWFSDSLTSFEGKEAAELIQGTWINEVGELTAMNKQETNAVKQFLSKTDDIYRAAYGRHTNRYPRRCVFFGTSNEHEFLKDRTGNRRFWPVDTGIYPAQRSVWDELPGEVDQIWAEAYTYWILGEPLHMSMEEEKLAEEMQDGHREMSEKEGQIREFLDRNITPDWDSLSLTQRKQFYAGGLPLQNEMELVERSKICAAEIWVECFNGDLKFLKKAESREINSILSGLPGWERLNTPRKFGLYGQQRGYRKTT